MPPMREILGLALLCLIVILGAVGVLVRTFFQGTSWTMDRLLLAAVCLLLAGIFGFCFLWLARDAHLWEMLKNRRPIATNPDKPNAKQ